MPGTGSIQLARIFGIRIGVDASWFLILFFFIFLLSGSFRSTLDSSDGVAYATAVASALLFFASLVLHELGHALAARRQGIGIAGIDLWFFGGIAKMTRDTSTPGGELKVAVAGPLVTLAIVGICLAAGIGVAGGWNGFFDIAALRSQADATPPLLLISFLATMNAVLFAFNLIPAFPLDGGRIARALAWRLSGDRLRATRIAAALGQAFAYVLIALGLFLLFIGDFISGLWFAVLGWFLRQAARAAVAQTAFSERLGGVTVADIMDAEPVSVPAELPVQRALDEYFLRYRWPWFPVVDAAGRPVGVVRQEIADGAVTAAAGERAVQDVMERVDGNWRVVQDASLESVLGAEGLRRIGALLAVDPDGVLRGVVTIDQVRRALNVAMPSSPAP